MRDCISGGLMVNNVAFYKYSEIKKILDLLKGLFSMSYILGIGQSVWTIFDHLPENLIALNNIYVKYK